jgi:hypothetical protein
MKELKHIFFMSLLFASMASFGQQTQEYSSAYKKRVLETTEIDIITSYYSQDGNNPAVTGGVGTEELSDVRSTFIISIPLNADNLLTIDAEISEYTSASSSNIDPFDKGKADPFQASSGASSSDIWANFSGSYTHNSEDRNSIWSANISLSTEYDYSSLGGGGSFTRLFNEKNTELSLHVNLFLDSWKPIYPYELRPFKEGGNGINNELFRSNAITGNENYHPVFNEFTNKNRNSYSLGLGFSQILNKNVQGSLAFDFVRQKGLLSTPFQRIYFADMADSYIDNFQLADAIEQLPDTRNKVAIGSRLNWYLNEYVVLRTFYRYYFDNWGIYSNTVSIEVPVKIAKKFTLYPSYRFYNQTAADYFKTYEEAISTEKFYTSDYDLSKFLSNQFGLGISYTDIFTKTQIMKMGLKGVDFRFYKYDRNTAFGSFIFSVGLKFVMD